MQHQILYKPSYAMAVVTLQAGEHIDVEAGSMVAMTHGMKINFSGKLYEAHGYQVHRDTELLDYDQLRAKALEPSNSSGRSTIPALTGFSSM